jgi:hypothetical protein
MVDLQGLEQNLKTEQTLVEEFAKRLTKAYFCAIILTIFYNSSFG